MKTLLLALATLSIALTAHAQDSKGGGGGDLCESRIQDIRNDLVKWINKGGHRPLTMNVSADTYASRMVEAAQITKIRCVSPGDKGYPVEVDGTSKECRFDRRGNKAVVTCDRAKFQSRSESEQYVLIHHEYAGVAGLENPQGDISSYAISKQVSEYLVDVTVKRLAVKAPTKTAVPGLPASITPPASAGWVLQPESWTDLVKHQELARLVKKTAFRDCFFSDIDRLSSEGQEFNFYLINDNGTQKMQFAFIGSMPNWPSDASNDDSYLFFNTSKSQMKLINRAVWAFKQGPYAKATYVEYTIQFDSTQKHIVSLESKMMIVQNVNLGTAFDPKLVIGQAEESKQVCHAKGF